MSSFDYVPVIKCNRAHVESVDLLFPIDQRRVKPLFEVPLRAEHQSISKHLDSTINALSARQSSAGFFFDPYGFLSTDFVDGSRADCLALEEADRRGATLVCELDNSDFPVDVAAELSSQNGRGMAFRISSESAYVSPDDVWEQVITISGSNGISGDETDLLIDFRSVLEVGVPFARDVVIDFLAQRPLGFRPRSVVIIGSSALPTVASIPRFGAGRVRRVELDIWANLQFEIGDSFDVAYGDYGVIHPNLVIAGPNKNANGKIRYTEGAYIHYFRGGSLYDPSGSGFKQYVEIARQVCESDAYQGRGFSAGDEFIARCAEGTGGTGNLASWVKIDLNHHLTYVSRQVRVLRPRLVQADSVGALPEIIASS